MIFMYNITSCALDYGIGKMRNGKDEEEREEKRVVREERVKCRIKSDRGKDMDRDEKKDKW